MLDEIRKRIVELVKQDSHLDGIDIAMKIGIPVDIAYNEIDVLIDMDILKREYTSMAGGSRLVYVGES